MPGDWGNITLQSSQQQQAVVTASMPYPVPNALPVLAHWSLTIIPRARDSIIAISQMLKWRNSLALKSTLEAMWPAACHQSKTPKVSSCAQNYALYLLLFIVELWRFQKRIWCMGNLNLNLGPNHSTSQPNASKLPWVPFIFKRECFPHRVIMGYFKSKSWLLVYMEDPLHFLFTSRHSNPLSCIDIFPVLSMWLLGNFSPQKEKTSCASGEDRPLLE